MLIYKYFFHNQRKENSLLAASSQKYDQPFSMELNTKGVPKYLKSYNHNWEAGLDAYDSGDKPQQRSISHI